jgi:hypothetical protein
MLKAKWRRLTWPVQVGAVVASKMWMLEQR